MKKVVSMLLFAALVVMMLAGCGTPGTEESPAPGSESDSPNQGSRMKLRQRWT